MRFIDAPIKHTEASWLRSLIGRLTRNGVMREGGLLPMLGWMVWHDNANNAPRACHACHAPMNLPRNAPGFPDIVAVRGEDLWFVELKSDRGRLSEHQRTWLDALKRVKRVHVALWRPEDLDRITEEMR